MLAINHCHQHPSYWLDHQGVPRRPLEGHRSQAFGTWIIDNYETFKGAPWRGVKRPGPLVGGTMEFDQVSIIHCIQYIIIQ